MSSRLRLVARAARRAAALALAVAQLCIVLAPLADASAGAPAAAHVEEQGTRIHFAHSADACLICAAQHIGGRPPLGGLVELARLTPAPSVFDRLDPLARSTLDITSAPRAPPV